MNNKRTTAILLILLALLIVLLVLRYCGSLSWSQGDNDTVWTAAWEEVETSENSYEEKFSNKTDVQNSSSSYAEIIETISQIDEKPKKVSEDIKVINPLENKQTTKSAEKQVENQTKNLKPQIEVQKVQTSSAASIKNEKQVENQTEKLKPKTLVQKTQTSSVDAVEKDVNSKNSSLPPAENKISKAPPKFINSGFKPFGVYTDFGSRDNHYMPYGYMGDLRSIKIDQGYKINPHSGKTCTKILYVPTSSKINWAGVYWQYPSNNWGDKGYGYNLTGAQRVSFWARGENGGEIINNFIIGGIQGKAVEDSDSRAIGPIELTREWNQYYIYLEGADLTNIIGGFCVTFAKYNNENGALFYLDDIIYE